jgi:hypothetical protein
VNRPGPPPCPAVAQITDRRQAQVLVHGWREPDAEHHTTAGRRLPAVVDVGNVPNVVGGAIGSPVAEALVELVPVKAPQTPCRRVAGRIGSVGDNESMDQAT